MKQQRLMVSSITYAIKGRDLLREAGFKAYIERTHTPGARQGCGYSILVSQNLQRAEQILREHQIKIIGIDRGEGNGLSG